MEPLDDGDQEEVVGLAADARRRRRRHARRRPGAGASCAGAAEVPAALAPGGGGGGRRGGAGLEAGNASRRREFSEDEQEAAPRDRSVVTWRDLLGGDALATEALGLAPPKGAALATAEVSRGGGSGGAVHMASTVPAETSSRITKESSAVREEWAPPQWSTYTGSTAVPPWACGPGSPANGLHVGGYEAGARVAGRPAAVEWQFDDRQSYPVSPHSFDMSGQDPCQWTGDHSADLRRLLLDGPLHAAWGGQVPTALLEQRLLKAAAPERYED